MRTTSSLAIVTVFALALLGGALGAAADHLLPASGKPAAEPLVCAGNRDLEIRNRSIRAAGDGVVASGNCSVRIVDSHIVAAGVGVRADGNADVEIVGSFVQGRAAAVYADGNAEAAYRASTLRGGAVAEGNAELSDGGGNLFERIPGAAASGLTPGAAIACGDRDRLTVVHRYVESEEDGVVLTGDCELLLSDSHVSAAGAAVRVVGDGSVRIRNSTLEGRSHAVRIEGGGTAVVAGSNLAGAVDGGLGRYVDAGGNSRDVGDQATAASAPPAPSRARAGTGIRIGPQGVEVTDPTGRVRVGPGGVVIEGPGEAAPGEPAEGEESARHEPVESCAELCVLWPALTTSQRDCVAVVIRVLDYPIDDTPACYAVETAAQCRACWRAIRASDRDCRAAYDRCLAR